MILNRRLLVGSLAAAVSGILPTLSFAQGKGTIAIITPSDDTAFFKAEADGAAAKAGVALRPRVSSSATVNGDFTIGIPQVVHSPRSSH